MLLYLIRIMPGLLALISLSVRTGMSQKIAGPFHFLFFFASFLLPFIYRFHIKVFINFLGDASGCFVVTADVIRVIKNPDTMV